MAPYVLGVKVKSTRLDAPLPQILRSPISSTRSRQAQCHWPEITACSRSLRSVRLAFALPPCQAAWARRSQKRMTRSATTEFASSGTAKNPGVGKITGGIDQDMNAVRKPKDCLPLLRSVVTSLVSPCCLEASIHCLRFSYDAEEP